jgi:predicted phage terminase large subunit-like protein
MLAEDILSFEEFDRRRKSGDAQLIAANYQQEPFDAIDKLYPSFSVYTSEMLPDGRNEAYFDTADEGQDYLAGACYVVHNNTAYITDIIYTQDPMEVTEGQAAYMISTKKTQKAWIESNNGGKGFARNVERLCREIAKYSGCQFNWFHQGQNKVARILSTSTNVCNSIKFPHDWHTRWPDFYRHVTSAGRTTKWVHDDAFDLLAGIVEKSIQSNTIEVVKNRLPNL